MDFRILFINFPRSVVANGHKLKDLHFLLHFGRLQCEPQMLAEYYFLEVQAGVGHPPLPLLASTGYQEFLISLGFGGGSHCSICLVSRYGLRVYPCPITLLLVC